MPHSLYMAEEMETFTERFNRLTGDMSEAEIGVELGIGSSAVRKLQHGTTKSLKAHAALRLAKRVGVDVAYLSHRGPLPPREPTLTRETAPPVVSMEESFQEFVAWMRSNASPDGGVPDRLIPVARELGEAYLRSLRATVSDATATIKQLEAFGERLSPGLAARQAEALQQRVDGLSKQVKAMEKRLRELPAAQTARQARDTPG
jgi:hypothetical protein